MQEQVNRKMSMYDLDGDHSKTKSFSMDTTSIQDNTIAEKDISIREPSPPKQ